MSMECQWYLQDIVISDINGGQMRVLVIGSGGRESAIVYKLSKSPKVEKIYAMPGNPGMAAYAELVSGSVTDFDKILEFVNSNAIDLTIIGPEVPLCLGLADILTKEGHLVFGPSAKAARLEGSKAYSKTFMEKYNIPTAAYVEVDSYEASLKDIGNFSYPLVIKADGLAAGKGVVICEDEATAKQTLKEMLVDGILDGAGNKVVIEEFLKGFECSLLCFCDGDTIIPMVSCKDHKQIFDNNKGPNTGGMGTVSPNPFLPKEISDRFEDVILRPFMKGLKGEGLDFRGVIFIGLMIDGEDIKVLEFNVRFGDPETQVI
ncbi:MAG: phosphoribosylamine--glycine ligase, partial [Eubacteriales bacterium]|nr:phosphoribosylamine--glycine ligase [Eubacteriales bacterium]